MVTPLVESPRLSVFMVEEGGLIGDRADRARRAGVAPQIMRQHRGELPESFARRCRLSLAELEAKGALIEEVTFIGGGLGRRARTLSRAALIRAILGLMVRRGEGRLILTGREEDRRVMESLAQILGAQLDPELKTGKEEKSACVEILTEFDRRLEPKRAGDDGARMTRP